MIEYAAYFVLSALTVAAGYEDLRPDAEAESYHEYDEIVDPGYGRGTELDFADTAEEGSVGHTYQLFHQQAYEYGVGDVPYTLV